jgi:hypothetical protein
MISAQGAIHTITSSFGDAGESGARLSIQIGKRALPLPSSSADM